MRCVIIAGSPDTNSDFLSEVIKPDDYVICADRGCNFAKQAGITPNLVVGDFDSEPDVLFPNCETVRLIPEKDDTDTMHSVDLALEKRFDEIARMMDLAPDSEAYYDFLSMYDGVESEE